MPRPLIARIDGRALSHNLAAARTRAGRRFVWAVAKANAYGHGLERAVRAFAAADGLALLEIDEAQRARDSGWSKPILLLEGVFEPRELDLAIRLDVTCVVHCVDQVEMIERRPDAVGPSVYLKLDSGMNRLGFAPQDAVSVRQRLEAVPGLRIAALMSHLANADRREAGPCDVQTQRRAFERLCKGTQAETSLCNSAGLFLHPDLGDRWVRPGNRRRSPHPPRKLNQGSLTRI